MIADRDVAKRILEELFEVGSRLDWSVATVKDRCPESELVPYRRAARPKPPVCSRRSDW